MGQPNCGRVLGVWGDLDSSAPLRSVFRAAGFEVVEASSEAEALDEAGADLPTAVLVDLDDRDTSGYLVCKLLRERHGELLPIILLSGEKTEPADRVAGLLLGADDYVVKPFHPSELVARIRRIVARSTSSIPEVDEVPVQAQAVDDFELTTREQEIMCMLLQGLTQSEIARKLVISPNTVATHIQRILLKLGVHNRAQAVAKAARAGWLQRRDFFAPDSPDGFAVEDVVSVPDERPRRAG